MGVKYFLVCVRKHKSNLSTNICTTVGKKTQWSVQKCELLSETTFLPYFMTVWCVFFTKVCIILPITRSGQELVFPVRIGPSRTDLRTRAKKIIAWNILVLRTGEHSLTFAKNWRPRVGDACFRGGHKYLSSDCYKMSPDFSDKKSVNTGQVRSSHHHPH